MGATVLIVDDEENTRINLEKFLVSKKYEALQAENLAQARSFIHQGKADIVLLDVHLPDGYGPDLIDEIARLPIRPPVIVITAYGDVDMAVDSMKSGAQDFLQKPIQLTQLEKSIERAYETVKLQRELNHLRQSQIPQLNFVIGNSDAMKKQLNYAQRAASLEVPVLITGETGTGKEVLARTIWKMGPRAKKPFIDINCAALQPTMIETELFGHEAHAFTGAEKRKTGLMEVADGGILFLDEISSMPPDMQAKILRAIQEKSFRRVGGTTTTNVDVVIIAASNRDLKEMIRLHEFRDDLYYRLKVVDLHIPPLRERREDIPDLVGSFIRFFNQDKGINIIDITPRAMEVLIAHNWPGNIRELRNAIERAITFCDDGIIDISHLPGDLQ